MQQWSIVIENMASVLFSLFSVVLVSKNVTFMRIPIMPKKEKTDSLTRNVPQGALSIIHSFLRTPEILEIYLLSLQTNTRYSIFSATHKKLV
jgi:hypothetical protein